MAAAGAPAHAMAHHATYCQLRISSLVWQGKPLSYESVAHVGDSYRSVSASGTVFTSLMTLPDGRKTHLAVEKDGCARAISSKAYYAEPLRRVRGAGLR